MVLATPESISVIPAYLRDLGSRKRPEMITFRSPLVKIFMSLLFLFLFAGATYSQIHWVHVETARFDWGHGGHAFTFVIDRPSDYSGGGDSTRLRILAPNGSHYTFVDKDGLTTLADSVPLMLVTPHLRALVKRNPARSRHLLFLPTHSSFRKPFLLFVFGWAYASSPGSIHVIALIKGVPKQILYKRDFQIVDYAGFEDNGPILITGKPCLSQEWGNGLLTYDPYWVYSLPPGGAGAAHLSLPLSKEYNLKHYYGWAGPNCSEKLAVVLHPPGGGKPLIMDAKKAEALTEGIAKP